MDDGYALDANPEDLLRGWHQWWRTMNQQCKCACIPRDLQMDTAAYLAARAVAEGRKVYGPESL